MRMRFMKSKDKMFVVLVIGILLVFLLYLYLDYTQEFYRNAQLSGDRCMSELSSVKYQLNVVTEYKNKLDKLLSEVQKAHESDKELFKELIDSCAAMKQQVVICQNQFEDLQGECKTVRHEYDKLSKGLKKQER